MIYVYQSKREISFKVSGKAFQELSQWSYSIDKAVFREQLNTGKFRNHELGLDILAIMKQVEREGRIMPYYGLGGSSGVCKYCFRISNRDCFLHIEHGFTEQWMELKRNKKLAWFPIKQAKKRRFKFSPLPYITNLKLPKAWSGGSSQALICRIMGKEYQKLASWKLWDPNLALSEHYTYCFGEVSLGSTGFTVEVQNSVSGEKIILTDYENW